MKMQRCKQCGEIKTIDQFRKYYGGRKAHYKTCKDCEKVNSRYKYLSAKAWLTNEEVSEKDRIEELYVLLRANGLQPPRHGAGRTITVNDTVDTMLEKYKLKEQEAQEVGLKLIKNVPEDLLKWLRDPLDDHDPEYLQDVIYEDLKRKYRPQIGMTSEMVPLYNNEYKEVLDAILERFDDYEDAYYDKD
jgi:hypothetical protein